MGHNTCKSMGRVLCVVRRYYQIRRNWGSPAIVSIVYYDVIIGYGRLGDIHVLSITLSWR